MTTSLMIFQRFPTPLRRFLKILPNSPEGHTNVAKGFPKISEDTSTKLSKKGFLCDVTAAILVLRNNEIAAMLVYQTTPVVAQFFPHVNTFFCCIKFTQLLAT